MRYKQAELSECARDYLVALAAEIEERKAAGHLVNEAFLEQVRSAIPTAPNHFILHGW